MTQKDFKAIAKAFSDTKPVVDGVNITLDALIQWKLDVSAMAEVLHLSNPRFKFDVFRKACGYEL